MITDLKSKYILKIDYSFLSVWHVLSLMTLFERVKYDWIIDEDDKTAQAYLALKLYTSWNIFEVTWAVKDFYE